jgi:DNA-directed RNA polymerase specialized sigma24 family protein
MHSSEMTCWTVIHGAANGRGSDRAEFSRRYEPVIRAYLGARWRGSTLAGEIDDAAQEVFLDFFRENGALGRADPERPGGFRAFLYGVTRHVAQRLERARTKAGKPLEVVNDAPATERNLSGKFDRAWARTLLRQAARLHADRAPEAGPEAVRRVELLRLRFHDGLPIRDIARLWETDAARLHHEYAKARREFRAALRDVVAEHMPGPAVAIESEAERLIACFRD